MQILLMAVLVYGIVMLQRKLYSNNWDKELYLNVAFEDHQVHEGETTNIIETVINNKWLPLPFLYIRFKLEKSFQTVGEERIAADDKYSRDDLLNVLMKQSIKRKIKIKCAKRGKYTIDGFSVNAYNLLLDEKHMADYSCNSTLTVYPVAVDARRFEKLLKCIDGDLKNNNSLQDDPFLIRGCREYQTYDEMRLINWNATARSGELRVNILEKQANRDVYIYVNLETVGMFHNNEILEESIRLGKSFAMLFSKNGIKSCVMTNGTNGKNGRLIAVRTPDKGPAYINRVDEALAEIWLEDKTIQKTRDESEESFFALYEELLSDSARKGFIVLISNSRERHLQEYMQELKREGRPFVWIVPIATGTEYEKNPLLDGYEYAWRLSYEGAEVLDYE